MRFAASILMFVAGSVFGAAALGGYWYWHHGSTEVWVTIAPMRSPGGIVVPAGTELVLSQWMPEGYAALELSINVEGAALDKFERRLEEKTFLRIPYWIGDDGE